MQKQYIPAALALILALSAGSSYAPANVPQNGECPPAFMLWTPPFSHPADINGDGCVCRKMIMPPQGRSITVVMDNRFPL